MVKVTMFSGILSLVVHTIFIMEFTDSGYSISPRMKNNEQIILLSDGGRSVGLENTSESLFGRSGEDLDDGELELRVSVSSGEGSSDIISLGDDGSSQDVDGIVSGSVFTTHIDVKLRDGTVQSDVSEFLVHVVNSSSRLISESDSVSLNGSLVSFEDFADGEDFTLSSLKLVLSSSLEPELGSSDDFIRGEDSHGDDFRFGGLFSGDSSASHQVLVDVHFKSGVGLNHFRLSLPVNQI
jgi:hypothetical protein